MPIIPRHRVAGDHGLELVAGQLSDSLAQGRPGRGGFLGVTPRANRAQGPVTQSRGLQAIGGFQGGRSPG